MMSLMPVPDANSKKSQYLKAQRHLCSVAYKRYKLKQVYVVRELRSTHFQCFVFQDRDAVLCKHCRLHIPPLRRDCHLVYYNDMILCSHV